MFPCELKNSGEFVPKGPSVALRERVNVYFGREGPWGEQTSWKTACDRS